MRILTIVGARPQFIKAAVVSRALRERQGLREVLVHTGQHYDATMSDVFFRELDLSRPDYDLGIGGGSHGQNTGRMIEAIEKVLTHEKPDRVLVYGDTDSTLAGALAAVKLHIPVAHVEAGLRSFNRRMPEEINRILTDVVADKLFVPTETAVKNLAAEGITGEKVRLVGDVMYDAALYYGDKAERRSQILEGLNLAPKGYVLATIHRKENTDDRDRLAAILHGFSKSRHPIIFPLHPRTRERLEQFKLTLPESVRVIDPVGYLDMVKLELHAVLIATDSGGVQKEAYFHRVPCITLRDETEWVELLEAGANRLIGVDAMLIGAALTNAVDTVDGNARLFGNGDSGDLIAENLAE